MVTVKSGSEPTIFTCHFLGWDATAQVGFVDPYEAKVAAALKANPVEVSDPPQKRESVGGAALAEKEYIYEPNYQFSYEKLKLVSTQRLKPSTAPACSLRCFCVHASCGRCPD